MSRKSVVREGEPGVYHCVSRCVRRAFLCGLDRYSRKNYNHRRKWVRDRLKELSEIFSCEVYAYAVMANHCHVVLRIDPVAVRGWTAREVVERWLRLFPWERDGQGNPIPPTPAMIKRLCGEHAQVNKWRERLGDLSWMMRCLNERIARRANAEDRCTGRFWEGRFKCQRIEDDGALLACMSYVDLNPVRAGLAESLEGSDFTSVQERILAYQRERMSSGSENQEQQASLEIGTAAKTGATASDEASWLTPIDGIRSIGSEAPWLLETRDYLRLVDETGRCLKLGKKGRIDPHLEPILDRLDLDQANWLRTVSGYRGLFHRVAGKSEQLLAAARKVGQQWFRGLSSSRKESLPYCLRSWGRGKSRGKPRVSQPRVSRGHPQWLSKGTGRLSSKCQTLWVSWSLRRE